MVIHRFATRVRSAATRLAGQAREEGWQKVSQGWQHITAEKQPQKLPQEVLDGLAALPETRKNKLYAALARGDGSFEAWLATLPPDERVELGRRIADFCASFNAETNWLLDQRLNHLPQVRRAGEEAMLLAGLAAWRLVPIQNELKFVAAFEAWQANPARQVELTRRLFVRAVEHGVIPQPPSELLLASEQAGLAYILQAVSQAMTTNRPAFNAVFKEEILADLPAPALELPEPPKRQRAPGQAARKNAAPSVSRAEKQASLSSSDSAQAASKRAKVRSSVRQFLKQAAVYLRPFWKSLLFVAATIFMSKLFKIALLASPKLLIDQAVIPGDTQLLVTILAGLAGLFMVASAGEVVGSAVMAQVQSQLKQDMRLELFTCLQRLPTGYFSRTPPGEISNLFGRELLLVHDALRHLVPESSAILIEVILAAIALFALDWRLALVVTVVLPVLAILPRQPLQRAKEADAKSKAKDAVIAGAISNNIEGHALIRAFGLEEVAIAEFSKHLGKKRVNPSFLDELKRGMRSSYFLKHLVQTLSNLQHLLIIGLVTGIGSYLAMQHLLTPATLLTFIPILAALSAAIASLSGMSKDVITAATCMERLDRVKREAVAMPEAAQPVLLPQLARRITVESVNFGYDPQYLNLQDISFKIPAGTSVAIVGRSGAGKSTLLKLLMRLYDPDSGSVSMDGHDLRQASRQSLRSQIGAVLQFNPVFNTTIRENIRMVKPNATDTEIEAAVRAAELHEAISRLPQGYDTRLGEGGVLLSAGQAQRLAIARAILRNPALLILDEATAALDPETEAAINATLQRLAEDRTVIMVTHRLASVAKMADRILVLDQGRLIESGTHRALLNRQDAYYALWQWQSGFKVSGDGRQAEVNAERLRLIPLFETLDEAVLVELAQQFVPEYFKEDELVISQGEPGEKFYIIVRGKVSLFRQTASAQPVELAVLHDGDYFGEIALIEEGLRTATVKTLLPSLFLTLDRERFSSMVSQNITVGKEIQDMGITRSLKTTISQGRRKSSLSHLDKLL